MPHHNWGVSSLLWSMESKAFCPPFIKVILTISHKNSSIISCVLVYLLWNISYLGQLWLHLRQTPFTKKTKNIGHKKHLRSEAVNIRVSVFPHGRPNFLSIDQPHVGIKVCFSYVAAYRSKKVHKGLKRFVTLGKIFFWKWNYCDAWQRKIIVIVVSVSFFFFLKTALIHGVQEDPVKCVQ